MPNCIGTLDNGARDCPSFGYPILGDMCVDHFRDLEISPAWQAYCEAETTWITKRDLLYQVEMARGDRARVFAEMLDPTDRRKRRAIVDFAERPRSHPRRTLKPTTKQQSIVDDDEDINNDV